MLDDSRDNQDFPKTDFGFEEIPVTEKSKRVRAVFNSVAKEYDLMNDFMSFGLHRIWKTVTVDVCDFRSGDCVLDLAGGTADLTKLILKKTPELGQMILADINAEMLSIGRNKLIDCGLWKKTKIIQADAESLPFPNHYFHAVIIGFGLRNVTNKDIALAEIYRVLRPGGQVFILEFSECKIPFLKPLYDWYSFNVLPKLGKVVAKDEESYRYLAESIRRHPNQKALLQLMKEVGFSENKVNNFLGGIVALHRGTKL